MTSPAWIKTVPGQNPCVANRDFYLKLSDEEDRIPPTPQGPAPHRAQSERREAERAELITYMELTAKHLCEGCPLYSDCLHDAVTGPPVAGFVAGTNTQERNHLRQVLDVPAEKEPHVLGFRDGAWKVSEEALDEVIAGAPDAPNAELGRLIGCSAHTVARHRRRRAAEQDTPQVAAPSPPTPDDTRAAVDLLTATAA